MHTYELEIEGAESDPKLWAARWALFVHHEIRDLRRCAGGRVEILYEGGPARVGAWLETLRDAGFGARPAGRGPQPREAA